MSQYGFHFNSQRCTGCKTCVMACKDYHDLDSSVSYRQVYEYVEGDWDKSDEGVWSQTVKAYYVSLSCNHCSRPVCVEVCPTQAMHKDVSGLVSVDVQRCIGCGYCELSCPYRAPKINKSLGHSVKCDGCLQRVEQGLAPVCVEACPLRALNFGIMDDLASEYGVLCAVAPLPEEEVTYPNLVITPSRNSCPASSKGGLQDIGTIV